MKEFKIGGKVTLGEDESYIIVDIIEYEDNTYYFVSSTKKPIIPKVFQRIEEDGKVYIECMSEWANVDGDTSNGDMIVQVLLIA